MEQNPVYGSGSHLKARAHLGGLSKLPRLIYTNTRDKTNI